MDKNTRNLVAAVALFTAWGAGLTCAVVHRAPAAPAEPAIPTPKAATQQAQNFGNPSWGNGRTMCLDPAASTSCSGGGAVADSNDGSCTCTAAGVGPLLHWWELVNRWQGTTPYFNMNTQVTLVSSQSNAQLIADPIVIAPRLRGYPDAGGVSNAAQFTFLGQTSITTATTISAINAKNRNSGTQLRVTLTAGQTITTLYQNTTHPATAWSVKSQAGGFLMSQPLEFAGLNPTTSPSPISAEVDTWATTDAVNVLAIPNANITQITPTCDIEGAGEGCAVLVQDVSVAINSPLQNLGDQVINVGPYVVLVDDYFGEGVMVSGPAPLALAFAGSSNVFYNGGFFGGFTGTSTPTGNGGSPAGTWTILGGVISNSSNAINTSVFENVTIDGDTDFETTGSFQTNVFAGNNYVGFIEANNTFNLKGGVVDTQKSLYDAGGGGCWWYGAGAGGAHTLDTGRGTVYYPSWTGAGGAAFPNSFVLEVGGKQVCCVAYAAGSGMTCNQSLTTGTSLDSLLGPDSGCATVGGGTSGYCNSPL
jgi:hypothetical protein